MIQAVTTAALAALATVAPAIAAAGQQPAVTGRGTGPPLATSLAREVSRLSTTTRAAEVQTPPRKPQRSFLTRHPVLSGLLIGAAGGTAIAAGASGNEGAFVGFYGGAAAGATTGWLLSR